MSLTAGESLGPYQILERIGAGGMGEVYRARDTQLERDVAVKVLPAFLANNPDRLARFDREAKILASLNHPNIAAIYGLSESAGQRALVMELVPGETLAERIARGPIPLKEALKIAQQITEALEAAHEKGVVHRDLKPGNVMITPAGLVKVLDFGLAAMSQSAGSTTGDLNTSPTLTLSMTGAGTILGTAAYMAPEQAAGTAVDRRADIWSFGAVLWEMLTGKQLFSGDTMAHTLADVLRAAIPFGQVAAPAPVKALLQRCLDREVKTRLQWIGEARIAIGRFLADPQAASQTPAFSRVSRGSRVSWVIAAVLAVAVLALGYVSYRHTTEEEPRLMRLSVLPPEKGAFSGNSIPAISPDGRRIAFVAALDGKSSLWVRDLDALVARSFSGTEDAEYPFWSPDSRTVAFFSGSKLRKIDIAGGPALTLCDTNGAGRGGTWAGDTIVFGIGNVGTLYQVSAAGGAPTLLLKPDAALGETLLRWPWFLPDGRHFLYSANNGDAEKVAVYVGDLVSKTHKRLMAAASNTVYVSPPGIKQGQLLFVREGTLMAQPFDPGKLQTTGDAVPIAEEIERGTNSLQNQFSASQSGILAFKSGNVNGGLQLTWFDRSGKSLGTVGPSAEMSSGVISPDGTKVAFDRREPQSSAEDIWVYDVPRGTTTRFTFGPNANTRPVWSSDGAFIAFGSNRDTGVTHVFQRATNAGTDQALTPSLGNPPFPTRPEDWSRDGRYLVEVTARGSGDIWVQPLFGDKKPFPYLATPYVEQEPRISPDSRWLAYASNESKRGEVYVQSFPTPGNKAQVSTDGGVKPVWSRDGKELYFIGADRKMMAVNVKLGNRFEADTPKALFDTRIGNGAANHFDVTKDGRFLIPAQSESAVDSPLTVVVNWPLLLKK